MTTDANPETVESPVSDAAAVTESPAVETAEAAAGEPVAPETATDTAVAVASEPPKSTGKKHWYVVKVQSGREDSIKEAIERRVKIEGLEEFFGQVVVPVERVTEIRNGKRVVKKRKKFPGYVMAEVEYNDRVLYLFRETSGVGDFVGGSLTRAPAPISDREVQSMLSGMEESKAGDKGSVAPPPTKIPFHVGDKVRVRDGIFQGSEGEIKEIREPKDAKDTYRIKVELTVWGRPVPVELEYWQIDLV
jgi:transcriptional antiterminator NusG